MKKWTFLRWLLLFRHALKELVRNEDLFVASILGIGNEKDRQLNLRLMRTDSTWMLLSRSVCPGTGAGPAEEGQEDREESDQAFLRSLDDRKDGGGADTGKEQVRNPRPARNR